jgi:hypothetical protein
MRGLPVTAPHLDTGLPDATTIDGALTVVAATPMQERNEAITDVVVGAITGFVLAGFLVAIAAYIVVRRSAAVIEELAPKSGKNAHMTFAHQSNPHIFEIDPALTRDQHAWRAFGYGSAGRTGVCDQCRSDAHAGCHYLRSLCSTAARQAD